MDDRFAFACRLDDVPPARARAVVVGGLPVAVVRRGADVAAFSGRCPHAAGPMGRGWVEDGELVCPLHRWRFRLDDGRCTTVRGERLEPVACEVRGDEVWVAV
jgi:nitrite reductase/ring-hydroxylating ferredoxin subunit